MSALCLTSADLAARVFATVLTVGWTDAHGVPREESWHVWQGQFELLAARARQADGWRHAWPTREPQPRLSLRRAGLAADYVICGDGWCAPLERLLPRARAPVVQVAPC
jgi:hypothetical protein